MQDTKRGLPSTSERPRTQTEVRPKSERPRTQIGPYQPIPKIRKGRMGPVWPTKPPGPRTGAVCGPPAVEPATQGGSGAGTGAGAGVGDGPGTGSGSGSGMGDGAGRSVGHQLIQGPANAVVTQGVAIGQIAAGAERYAVLTCRIGLNERLQGCRLAREHPLGDGAGRDAMVRAREFRIRPPIRNGVYVDGQPVTIAVILPPRADRRRGIRR